MYAAELRAVKADVKESERLTLLQLVICTAFRRFSRRITLSLSRCPLLSFFIPLCPFCPTLLCSSMTRVKQESISLPPAVSSLRSGSPPPPHTVAASTAEDVAFFLARSVQSDRSNNEPPSTQQQEQHPAEQNRPTEALQADSDYDSEYEMIPAEDQLDPNEPIDEPRLQSMCAARLARIRLHWAQQLRSVAVKKEAEAQAAQQVLAAYDDLYEESDRGEDDSDGSEDGHQAWCAETDWDWNRPDDSDDSQFDSDEETWQQAAGEMDDTAHDMQQYSQWRTAGAHDEADGGAVPEQAHEGDEEEIDEEQSGLGDVTLHRGVVSDAHTEVKEEQRHYPSRRPPRSTAQHRDSDHDRAYSHPLQPTEPAHVQPLHTADISDILSEGPTSSQGSRGPGYVWHLFENGSEGWVYDRAKEEEWIRQELGGARGSNDSESHSQPALTAEPADVPAVAGADECSEEMEESEDNDSEEESEEEDDSVPQSKRRRPRRTQRHRAQQSERQHSRPIRRVEQRKTVRTESSTVRKRRTTTTQTTRYSYTDHTDHADNHSDSSAAPIQHTHSKRRKAAGRAEKRTSRGRKRTDRKGGSHTMLAMGQAPTLSDREDSPVEMEVEDTDAYSAQQRDQRAIASMTERSRAGSGVCRECGEPVSAQFDGDFCSSLCQQWVGHKLFLSDMHRSTCADWQKQHGQYYQPTHNLPHYPVTDGLRLCQLPFAALDTEPLDRSSPIVRRYLHYQLTVHPALRLGRSPIHGTGLFARLPIAANSRVAPIFGQLYPRDQLLDDRDRLLPAARSMDRLIDVDTLNVADVTVVLSISRACVAGYVNSARGTGGRRNVRFECDERVRRRWGGEGWVPSGLMVVTTVRAVEAGEELLEDYPFDRL